MSDIDAAMIGCEATMISCETMMGGYETAMLLRCFAFFYRALPFLTLRLSTFAGHVAVLVVAVSIGTSFGDRSFACTRYCIGSAVSRRNEQNLK